MTVLWSVNRQDNAYSSPLQGSHFKKYWVFSWMHTCAFTWGHSDLKHQVLAAVETEGSKLSELMVGGTFLCHKRQVASITAPHTLQWVSHVEIRLSTARDNLCKLGMVAAVVSFILIQFTISIFRVKFYCANFELESSQVKSIVFSFPSSTIVMVRAGGGTWLFQGKKKSWQITLWKLQMRKQFSLRNPEMTLLVLNHTLTDLRAELSLPSLEVPFHFLL